MTIKYSECGDGVMKKGTIVDDRLSWHGHGSFQKRTHNGDIVIWIGKLEQKR